MLGDIGDRHLFARQPALDHQVEVALLGCSGGQAIEMIVGKARHRHFAQDTPLTRQRVNQRDATVLGRHPVGADPVEKRLGIAPGHVIFREAG